jgi:hypothetical protein
MELAYLRELHGASTEPPSLRAEADRSLNPLRASLRSTAYALNVEAIKGTPESIVTVVQRWQELGRPEQRGISWPLDRWVEHFPSHAERLRQLPAVIDREVVRAHSSGAPTSAAEAEWAFIVCMIWGYGRVGYGPFRAKRTLETPAAASILQETASLLKDDGPLAAYSHLGNTRRIKGFGPAFGTKYLYFCPQPSKDPQALILDQLVSTWLREHTDVKLNPVPWSDRTYQRYLSTMHEWAAEVNLRPDVLEQCIFVAIATARGGQWAASD